MQAALELYREIVDEEHRPCPQHCAALAGSPRRPVHGRWHVGPADPWGGLQEEQEEEEQEEQQSAAGQDAESSQLSQPGLAEALGLELTSSSSVLWIYAQASRC